MTTKMMMNILTVLMATVIGVSSVNAKVCNTWGMDIVICRQQGITSANVTGNRSQVIFLQLTQNQITSLPEGVFDKLVNLQTLYLDNNRITSLPSGVFDKLVKLQNLQLHENQIASLPEGVFDKLVNLQILYLNQNQIASLPEGVFDKLVNLQTLWLRRNQIASLPEGVFDKLVNLQTLWLHQNQIASLPEGVFDKLVNLQTLSLHQNKIASLPEGVFDKLVNLQTLYLFDIPATDLDCEFTNCTGLTIYGDVCFGRNLTDYCKLSYCTVPPLINLIGAGIGKKNSNGTSYRVARTPCQLGYFDLAPTYVTACSINITSPSFTNLSSSCTDVNECLVNNSCNTNIFTCKNTIGSYRCDCLDGYKQVNNFTCTDINECASSPCLNNGTCFNNLNNFNCSCADGFTGITCSDSSSGSSVTSNTVIVLICLVVYFNVSPMFWFLWN